MRRALAMVAGLLLTSACGSSQVSLSGSDEPPSTSSPSASPTSSRPTAAASAETAKPSPAATNDPASPAPAASPATPAALRTCGVAPDTTTGDVRLALAFSDVVSGSGADGVATLVNSGDEPIQVQDRPYVAANATREGRIVSAGAGTGDAPALVTIQPGQSRKYRVAFPTSACGFDQQLPPGSYLVAAEVLLQGGTRVVSDYVEVRLQP